MTNNKRTTDNPEPVDYELCVMSKSEQVKETEKRVREFTAGRGFGKTVIAYEDYKDEQK